MERPLYIENDNKHIFAVIHTPEKTTKKKGIIFVHPYAEEKQRVDRILVGFARRLCSKGWFVMRFDFYGCGDSEGNFEELSNETQISDLQNVKNHFVKATGVEEVCLFGVRLGANIAIQYAGMDNNITNIILWSPMLNGVGYAETLIRNKIFSGFMDKKNKVTREQILAELKENGWVDIDGFHLTKNYYDYLNHLNDITNSSIVNCDGFIGLTVTEGKFIENYSSLAKIFDRRGNKCDLVATDDRLYWDQRAHYQIYSPDNLIDRTVDYLIRRYEMVNVE